MTDQESMPIPDWALLRRMMDAEDRPRAWRSAGLWALDVLADQMGGDWPARWWEKQGRLPPELILGTYLPAAFAGLLELALRLRVLAAAAGIAPIRRGLAGDLRDEGMQHTAVQLEVASLATQAGLDAAMETRLEGRDNPVDVRLGIPSGPIGIETFVVLKDQGTHVAERYMYELSRCLDEICWPLGVEIDGALEVRMSSEDTERWLREIEDAARKAAEVKRPQIVDWPSAYVTVIPIGAAERTSFLGPMERGAGWPRLVGILQKKAGQAALSGASWLRLDVKDGMFQLTDWSRMDLRGKLSVLADHLPHALQGVDWLDGVVVTSGGCQVSGEVEEEELHDERACHALRRRLSFMRARETFVLPLDTGVADAGPIWFDLYDREQLWLDLELERAGLPPVSDMVLQ